MPAASNRYDQDTALLALTRAAEGPVYRRSSGQYLAVTPRDSTGTAIAVVEAALALQTCRNGLP